MSIALQLRADEIEYDNKMKRAKCLTCKALVLLEPEQRRELEMLLPDRSFKDTSFARWLSQHTDESVSATSVGKHRKLHL